MLRISWNNPPSPPQKIYTPTRLIKRKEKATGIPIANSNKRAPKITIRINHHSKMASLPSSCFCPDLSPRLQGSINISQKLYHKQKATYGDSCNNQPLWNFQKCWI